MAESAGENFQVSDSETSKITLDAINTSFDAIQEMITNFTPVETKQDYAALSYSGELIAGKAMLTTQPSIDNVDIYGSIGTSYVRCGTLNNYVFNPIITVSSVTIYQLYRTL